jgi:hypothetical protein
MPYIQVVPNHKDTEKPIYNPYYLHNQDYNLYANLAIKKAQTEGLRKNLNPSKILTKHLTFLLL